MSARTLVAGFGNELRADDGYGVAVVHALEATALPPEVTVIEVGTGGIRLVQELLTGYDRVIVVDAVRAGDSPGTVTVRRVDAVELPEEVDLHLAVPARALGMARGVGALPGEVFLVGCEAGSVDDLALDMSPAVQAAVHDGVRAVRQLVAPRTREVSA